MTYTRIRTARFLPGDVTFLCMFTSAASDPFSELRRRGDDGRRRARCLSRRLKRLRCVRLVVRNAFGVFTRRSRRCASSFAAQLSRFDAFRYRRDRFLRQCNRLSLYAAITNDITCSACICEAIGCPSEVNASPRAASRSSTPSLAFLKTIARRVSSTISAAHGDLEADRVSVATAEWTGTFGDDVSVLTMRLMLAFRPCNSAICRFSDSSS